MLCFLAFLAATLIASFVGANIYLSAKDRKYERNLKSDEADWNIRGS